MSVEAMAWALNVPVSGNAKVLLIGLANHAHHDGSEAYPSLDTLAGYACCHRATARRGVRKLVEDGWLIEDGLGPRGQSKYRLPLGLQNATRSDLHGVASGHERGDTAVLPEPSIEPSSVDVARVREEADPFQHCFAYWQERTGHPRAKPTADLRRKFQARLAEGFTVDDVRTGIDGIAANGYVNERGVKHDDFELVVRNGEKLRLNIARASAGSLPGNVRELPQNSTASERRQANEKRQMEILMRQAGMNR